METSYMKDCVLVVRSLDNQYLNLSAKCEVVLGEADNQGDRW
jgi:hypothetical protein